MEIFGYGISFLALIITILTGVLIYLAWRNGRWMKQAHSETQALIKSIGELIVADGERTRELVMQIKADKAQ